MSASSLFPEPLTPDSSGNESGSRLGATQSLYRKHRPQTFAAGELVGQDAIVRTLKNAIRLDRVAHAYLFTGPRGTGKTTTARLLAKAVNCLAPDPDVRPCNQCVACVSINNGSTTDIIEIDAASNRGIDDIRELRERVKFAPTFLKTKFYIVDEAHQITGAAANAFLKTLEEPPAHTKFILATTDPEQLLPTIVSRCQRFDFKRFTQAAMVDHLERVAELEDVSIARESLQVIAEHAAGSMRDALGLLDQLSSYHVRDEADGHTIQPEDVRDFLGISRSERVVQLAIALADRDAGAGLALINSAFESGEDPRQLNRQFVALLRAIMFYRAGSQSDSDDELSALSRRFSLAEVAAHSARFSEVDYRIRHASLPQLPLEIAFVQATLEAGRDREPLAAAEPALAWDPAAARPAPQAPPRPTIEPTVSPPATSMKVVEPAPRPEPIREVTNEDTSSPDVEPVISRPDSAPPPSSGPITVDLLHDLWPKIRLDIKARDRRIEALLSSCDPAKVDGASITLVTNYKFHWEKMNEDASRALVESVIGRLVNQTVSVSTEMRGANGTSTSPLPATAAPQAVDLAADRSPVAIDAEAKTGLVRSDDELTLIDAAKKLFDAEEITPPV